MATRPRAKTPAQASQKVHERELASLRERMGRLEQHLAELRGPFPQEEVIVLRTLSREEALEEVRALFQTGEVLYYSDIACKLGLELPLVVELCQELEREGAIEVDAHAF